jgi:AcrR family transcriptional regulator
VAAKPDRNLREELLGAALAMLAETQPVHVPSLRSIAKACGVAPSAVYWHFPSEAELRSAVLDAEYASLVEAVEAALNLSVASGEEALEVAGAAYIEWGLAHPGAYQLLFEGDDAIPETRADAGPRLQQRIVELATLVDDEAFPAALLMWSLWHGIVSLRLHKPQWNWGMTPLEANDRTVHAMTRLTRDRTGPLQIPRPPGTRAGD